MVPPAPGKMPIRVPMMPERMIDHLRLQYVLNDGHRSTLSSPVAE